MKKVSEVWCPNIRATELSNRVGFSDEDVSCLGSDCACWVPNFDGPYHGGDTPDVSRPKWGRCGLARENAQELRDE